MGMVIRMRNVPTGFTVGVFGAQLVQVGKFRRCGLPGRGTVPGIDF